MAEKNLFVFDLKAIIIHYIFSVLLLLILCYYHLHRSRKGRRNFVIDWRASSQQYETSFTSTERPFTAILWKFTALREIKKHNNKQKLMRNTIRFVHFQNATLLQENGTCAWIVFFFYSQAFFSLYVLLFYCYFIRRSWHFVNRVWIQFRLKCCDTIESKTNENDWNIFIINLILPKIMNNNN